MPLFSKHLYYHELTSSILLDLNVDRSFPFGHRRRIGPCRSLNHDGTALVQSNWLKSASGSDLEMRRTSG